MAEYVNVELPFLAKLEELGWKVINQGFGIPKEPAKSLRSSFKEVTLKEEFKKSVKAINRMDDGICWLTDQQLEDLYSDVTATERSTLSLLEANRVVIERLVGKTKTIVPKNELTGIKNVLVKLIDFKNWYRNSFIAINQFRVVTAGGPMDGYFLPYLRLPY